MTQTPTDHPYLGIVKQMLGGNYRTVDEVTSSELDVIARRLEGCLAQIQSVSAKTQDEPLEILGKERMLDALNSLERAALILVQSEQQRKIWRKSQD